METTLQQIHYIEQKKKEKKKKEITNLANPLGNESDLWCMLQRETYRVDDSAISVAGACYMIKILAMS